jgi:tetratricopeptide (TPR) repeat protein
MNKQGKLCAVLAFVVACLAVRGEPADACGWDGPSVEELSTFDPQIVDGEDGDGLYYNPYQNGYGEACSSCMNATMLAEWRGYLNDLVTSQDWEEILLRASSDDLLALRERLAGKRMAAPVGYEHSSLWKSVTARPRLRAAIGLVQLARQVERIAGAGSTPANGSESPAKSIDLLAQAKTGLRLTREPFLAQRYAFQIVKILFYQRRWGELIEYVDRRPAALATPSLDLWWRTRFYLAGALLRTDHRARANLELARIHAGYPALAGAAANDFRPMEETDWRESLRLATATKEKIELWRLVGITRDGLVAMREIMKLDATSPLLALLMVREVERAEARTSDVYGISPDPKGRERQRKDFAELEQLAVSVATTAGADRTWLMNLIAGHLAAKRGDLTVAKSRLLQAMAVRPGDTRVRSQVQASLAMAMVLDGQGSRPAANAVLSIERGNAIALAMNDIDPTFARRNRVRNEVRGKLAEAYASAGRLVEAELLQPGRLEANPSTAAKWHDLAYLKALIARSKLAASPFDRFLLQDSYSRAQLELELALYYLTSGSFAEASKVFAGGIATSTRLGTDPFVARILDCHDCDHERYAESPWTHATFAARLVELERVANGQGEPAAAAALAIGNALYNISWYGNARVVAQGTHQAVTAPRAAERWYKRAYERSRHRELRAKAAFMAAKAELGALLAAAEESSGASAETDPSGLSPLPVPRTWFPVIETLADTRYYREVLAECSHFRSWTGRAR